MRFRLNPLICFKGDGGGDGGGDTPGVAGTGMGVGQVGSATGMGGTGGGGGIGGRSSGLVEAQNARAEEAAKEAQRAEEAQRAQQRTTELAAAQKAAAKEAQRANSLGRVVEAATDNSPSQSRGISIDNSTAPSDDYASDFSGLPSPLEGYSQADIATAMAQSDVQAGKQADTAVAMEQSNVQAAENDAQISNVTASEAQRAAEAQRANSLGRVPSIDHEGLDNQAGGGGIASVRDLVENNLNVNNPTAKAMGFNSREHTLGMALDPGWSDDITNQAYSNLGFFDRLSVAVSYNYNQLGISGRLMMTAASAMGLSSGLMMGFIALIQAATGQLISDDVSGEDPFSEGHNITSNHLQELAKQGQQYAQENNLSDQDVIDMTQGQKGETPATPGLLNKPKSISTDVYGLLKNKDRRNWRIL